MTFLAVDTSSDYGVIVLADENGSVKASTVFEGRRSLSKRLLGVVDELLAQNGLKLRDLSGLAVGIGPGSFTGLRVGLTTMKTFAQVTRLPLVGVNTLDAYAHGITADTVIVATPSRRGEVYAGIYPDGQDSSPFACSYSALTDRCLELSPSRNVVLCGDPKVLNEISTDASRVIRTCTPPDGLAAVAAARFAEGAVDNPISLVPLYVVPPAISTPRDSSILPPQ